MKYAYRGYVVYVVGIMTFIAWRWLSAFNLNMTSMITSYSNISIVPAESAPVISASNPTRSHDGDPLITGARLPKKVARACVLPAVHPHPHYYLLNPARTVCRGDVFLIVYVHTAVSHVKQRLVIRETWGDRKQYALAVRVVFVMGIDVGRPSGQDWINYESSLYGDIIQKDFADTYHTLTYKAIAGLKWVSDYCTNAKFVLKTDDDVFVNMFSLLKHLQSRVGTKRLLLCHTQIKPNVLRSGKNRATWKDYAGDRYPNFCTGAAYVMTTDVVVDLYCFSFVVPFLWLDDVYVTGLLVAKAGNIKHTQFASSYMLNGWQLKSAFNGPRWSSLVFSHVHDFAAFREVWKTLVSLANGDSTVKIRFRKSTKTATLW